VTDVAVFAGQLSPTDEQTALVVRRVNPAPGVTVRDIGAAVLPSAVDVSITATVIPQSIRGVHRARVGNDSWRLVSATTDNHHWCAL